MKTNEITEQQREIIEQVRRRAFEAATSTVTDRAKAEAAVAIIVEPELKSYDIHWCKTPGEVSELRDRASRKDSLRTSVWVSLRDSLGNSVWVSLGASLWDSLSASITASLRASLWFPLRASLRDSLGNSSWDSLRNSSWDSLRDSGLTAFYAAPAAAGLVEYQPEFRSRLDAFVAFGESAFALWVVPGHVVILEKPTRAVVKDGNLVDIGWGNPWK